MPRSYEFSYEKCSEIFPDFFWAFIWWVRKIPQNSGQIPGKIPCEKSRKITDELLQKRREEQSVNLKFPNGRSKCAQTQKTRKRAQTRVPKRAQKSTKTAQRALPRENCKQPDLKQPGLGTLKSNMTDSDRKPTQTDSKLTLPRSRQGVYPLKSLWPSALGRGPFPLWSAYSEF